MYILRVNWISFAMVVLICASSGRLKADIYSELIVADDPVLYWRLGEPSGTTATNLGSLGSAADGVYGSTVTYGNEGIAPNSTDDAIGLMESTESRVLLDPFDMPSNDVSVSFWMNGDDGIGLAHFFGYAVAGSTNEFTFGVNENRFRAIINGVIQDFNTIDVMDEMDHHVGISWTDSTGLLSVFIDGELEISHNFAMTSLGLNGALAIGQDFDSRTGPGYGFASNQAFSGTIDEFAIFDRVLAPSEFRQHASGVPEPSSGLVLLTGGLLAISRRRRLARVV